MKKPKICVVIPTIREAQYKSFINAWKDLFVRHQVSLVTVWDGETPRVEIFNYGTGKPDEIEYSQTLYSTHKNLIYRYTDACRNLGFIVAAHLQPDYVLTLDDDVVPITQLASGNGWTGSAQRIFDPIQAHIDVLQKRVPLGWMNTAHNTELYLRGVPYGIREEAPVMLSHGVWFGTPDFDGETQLRLEKTCRDCGGVGKLPDVPQYKCGRCCGSGKEGVPYSLPYYVDPIPRGINFPLCGMNVMVKREALPYLYFAPMGVDTGITKNCEVCELNSHIFADSPIPDCKKCGTPHGSIGKVPTLNRFADIYMGIFLKRTFDALGWACYTGGSTILHTRASDAKKNFEQEKLGREWNEWLTSSRDNCAVTTQFIEYMETYMEKLGEYTKLIRGIFLNRS